MARKDDSGEFWREIAHLAIERGYMTQGQASGARGVRLYSTASAAVHGLENARYALQLRAPLRRARGGDSNQQMIATASLSRDALVDLRDALTAAIKTIDREAK